MISHPTSCLLNRVGLLDILFDTESVVRIFFNPSVFYYKMTQTKSTVVYTIGPLTLLERGYQLWLELYYYVQTT